MERRTEQQYGPAFMHPMMHHPPPPFLPQHQHQVNNAFYPSQNYHWFQPPPHDSTYNSPYSPYGCFPASRPSMKGPMAMPPSPPFHPPTFQHNASVGAQPVPANQNRQYAPPTTLAPLPSSARGPPCKPRQSGWAVWVGNLPQYTTVIHLKDYFSTGAMEDIESVFLITKTNCAFVNYKSETACLEAIHRFDNSQFRGNRLVCRMRRDSLNSRGSNASSSPPPPSEVPSLSETSSTGSDPDSPSETSNDIPLIVRGDDQAKRVDSVTNLNDNLDVSLDELSKLTINTYKEKAKMFILKSLTLQDLLVSTRDGSWVTQPHNEEKLNEAFKTAEDVYLVFSVNKSGQYFGYARMESSIPQSGSPTKSRKASSPMVAQRTEQASQGEDVPRSIQTPATATAPEGCIIDDSARGTIFWEAQQTEGEAIESVHSGASSDDSEAAAGGKQFSIRWISTTQVPFHATRGLRNPLNCNREVKIARDGTELEAQVGSRLLQLFHRSPAPSSMQWRN